MSDPHVQDSRSAKLLEIQAGFLERAGKELRDLTTALREEGQRERALGVLHRLKGAAGTCGLATVGEHVARAEGLLKANDSEGARAEIAEALKIVDAGTPDPVKVTACAEPSSSSGKTLLCIEDDPDIAQLIRLAARFAGFDVECASTGDAGWKLLEDGMRPSIVVLDLMLPGLDGLEILRLAREKGDVDDVPFLVLSAMSAREAREQSIHEGAAAFLSKPFEIDDLRSLLSELVPE